MSLEVINLYLTKEAIEGISQVNDYKDQLTYLAQDQFTKMQFAGAEQECNRRIALLDPSHLETMITEALKMEGEIKEQSGHLEDLDSTLKLCETIQKFNLLLQNINQENMRLGYEVEDVAKLSFWPDQEKIPEKIPHSIPMQMDLEFAAKALLAHARNAPFDDEAEPLLTYMIKGPISEELLVQLIKIASSKNPSLISTLIPKFKISEENKIIEKARIDACHNPYGTIMNIKKYGMDRNKQLEIAKLCFVQMLSKFQTDEIGVLRLFCELEFFKENFPKVGILVEEINNLDDSDIPGPSIEKLLKLAKQELGIQDSQLNWFKNTIEGLDPGHQRTLGLCLGMVLACCAIDPKFISLLDDNDVILTFQEFTKNKDSLLAYGSTRLLLTLFETDNSKFKETWKTLPSNLGFMRLSLSFFECDFDELLPLISKFSYKNPELLNTINETLIFLAQEKSFTPQEKGKFLKQFFVQIENPGNDQIRIINAVRNLLYYKEGRSLKENNPLELWHNYLDSRFPYCGESTFIRLCQEYPFASDKQKALEVIVDHAKRITYGGGFDYCLLMAGIPKEILPELVKIAAAINGTLTTENIKKYNFKDPELLFEIAKNAAKQSGYNVSSLIHLYGITDKNKLNELNEICFYSALRRSTYDPNISMADFIREKWMIENSAPTLSGWIIRTNNLSIPLEFNSSEEKEQCAQQIKQSIDHLFELAKIELSLQPSQLEWFKDVTGKLELHNQQKNAVWLGMLLARCKLEPNLLRLFHEKDALRTLQAIGKQIDPLLLNEATKTLLFYYADGNEKFRDIWKSSIIENIPSHLLLVNLFIPFFEPNQQRLLEIFNKEIYTHSEDITPINEVLMMLAKENNLTPKEKGEFLEKLFPSITKQEKEKAKDFKKRLEDQRKIQDELIISTRDLLFFERGAELKEATLDNLTEKWQTACKEIFGVTENFERFSQLFRSSKRYPGALFTYAARLYTLPPEERATLIPFIGKYVTAILDGSFPDMRYDLKQSEHLQTIFADRKSLLDAWRKPLVVNADEILGKSENVQIEKPQNYIKEKIRQAITEKHLGENQEKLYPTLCSLDWTNPEAVKKALVNMNARFENKSENKENMQIELAILKLLDPDLKPTSVVQKLGELGNKLSKKDFAFKNDIDECWLKLKPSKTTQMKWTVQDSDHWEDLLLMGTEVPSSCQSIDSSAEKNKCLLGYMLDGKTRLMVVKDAEGKIVARSVIRILWDDKSKSPVVFMEKIYGLKNPDLEILLLEACIRKAKALGLPLVASSKEDLSIAHELKSYPNPIKSLGSPAPFEYSDASGGVNAKGIFTVDKVFVVNS